ncbi:MAG: hypothetical protein AB1894_17270 [Chloroflexota bacterium]
METQQTLQLASARTLRIEEMLTVLILALTLVAAGAGVLLPGFYQGVVDPRYLSGTITADLVSLACLPLLVVCLLNARRGSLTARLVWISLLAYLGYAYAVYAFDRLYTSLFLVYVALFSLCVFAGAAVLAQIDIAQAAQRLEGMRLRRATAVFLAFTGLILYAIELPTILGRIPGGVQAGGTPFMVLDMALVAPIAALTGAWLWQRRPWGAVLTGVFLIKAITLMSSFLIADYYDWFTGKSIDHSATLAFTFVYLCVYFFLWNYLAAFKKSA